MPPPAGAPGTPGGWRRTWPPAAALGTRASRWLRGAVVARPGKGRPRNPAVGRAVARPPGQSRSRAAAPRDPSFSRVSLFPRTPARPAPFRELRWRVLCADARLGSRRCKHKGQASGCDRAETCPAPKAKATAEEKGKPGGAGTEKEGVAPKLTRAAAFIKPCLGQHFVLHTLLTLKSVKLVADVFTPRGGGCTLRSALRMGWTFFDS